MILQLRRAIGIFLITVAAAVAAATTWFLIPQDILTFAEVRTTWTPSDAYLLDRNGVLIDQQRLNFKVRRTNWTPLSEVSPALLEAIIDGEDRHFWHHSGIDWTALIAAIRDNGLSQRRRGASTISMQLAALLDPSVRAGNATGAWQRKLAQLRLAHALDAHWTKHEILEAYFNLLGFRGELQGIGATSQVLAGKAPSGLTLQESLVLAALLPAPRASLERVVTRACSRAAARHLTTDCDSIRDTAVALLSQNALAASSTKDRSTAVHLSPHLARTLLKHPGQRLRTTLDASIQRLSVDTLRQHLTSIANRNVRDGAVLVVDNDSGDVLAYVGSAGPQSRAREVDGVRARRQAGSTLKPFLYEMAVERRYLTAASLLNDSPITLDTASGIYLPQNYDRDFKGLVSVRTALGSSLNVPAVRALMIVGVEPFRDRLHALGYVGITQPGEFYGYSLALGSAEVSLWEQVQAYRTLARGGRWGEIQTQPRAGATADREVFARDAAFIVSDIISDRAARVVTFGLDSHLNTPFWSAVKTGTSKDMRDNWCIGFSRRFTVGVWVGNFEGDSMHDVSGVTGAAPVWQEIMVALHAGSGMPTALPELPAGVVRAVARFSPTVEMERHEFFLGAVDTAVSGAAPDATLARADERATSLATAAAESATRMFQVAGEIARIDSPANGMVIAIDPDIPARFQRVPLSARGADERMVLRLNGEVLGAANGSVMWAPERGTYLLALEDSAGHTLDSARFIVR